MVTGFLRGSGLSQGFCAARCVGEKLPTRPGICAGMPGGPSRPYLLAIVGLGLRARWWTPQPGRKNNGGEAEIRTLERVAPSTAFEIATELRFYNTFAKTSLGEAGFKGGLRPQVRSTHRVPVQLSPRHQTDAKHIMAPRIGTCPHVLSPSRTEQTRRQL